jgi:hypothetical protein
MSKDINVRWGWLKGMYILTIIHAGGSGLGIILIPSIIRSIFGWPSQDPIVFGICGSVWVAFGLLSILGLRSPLKFSPLLLLQLTYKVVVHWCYSSCSDCGRNSVLCDRVCRVFHRVYRWRLDSNTLSIRLCEGVRSLGGHNGVRQR